MADYIRRKLASNSDTKSKQALLSLKSSGGRIMRPWNLESGLTAGVEEIGYFVDAIWKPFRHRVLRAPARQ